MSAGNGIDGEVGRLDARLFGVDPSLTSFMLDISDLLDTLRTPDGVITFSDEQLEGMQARLTLFAEVVQTERARREQVARAQELFGSRREVVHLAAVVAIESHMAEHSHADVESGTNADEVSADDPAETERAFSDDNAASEDEAQAEPSEPEGQTDNALTLDRRTKSQQEATSLSLNGVDVKVYDRDLVDFLKILAAQPGKELKRADFWKLGFGERLKEGSSRSGAFLMAALKLSSDKDVLKRVGITIIGQGAGRKFVYRPDLVDADLTTEPTLSENPDGVDDSEDLAVEDAAALQDEIAAEQVDEGALPDLLNADAFADSIDESIRILQEQQPAPTNDEAMIEAGEEPEEYSDEEPQSDSEDTAEPVHSAEAQENQSRPEVLVVSNKGLGVRFADNGAYEIVLDGNTVTGFEEFGNTAALALIGLAIRLYGDETDFRELAERIERLGGEIEYGRLNSLLNRMRAYFTVGGQELVKKSKADKWSLGYSVKFSREQCIEILARFGFNEKQANHFLA